MKGFDENIFSGWAVSMAHWLDQVMCELPRESEKGPEDPFG
jgi:hypothetical protein